MKLNNRWIVLVSGVCIQIVLGGIYAWSTFVPYLINEYSLTKAQSGFIFGVSFIFFTTSMIFSGRLLVSHGPKLTAAIGALLFGLGYIIASFSGGSFIILLVAIGLISGSGIGFGYVCPLTTGIKHFPKSKGLVTGVAVAGFGGGAVLLSSLATIYLSSGGDVLSFFRIYGIITALVLLLSALLLAFPKEEKKSQIRSGSLSFLKPAFFLSALGLFAGTFAGLLIVGNLAPIVQYAGLGDAQIVTAISLFSLGNAVGRLSWGGLFDRLKFITIPLSLVFLALFCALLLLPLHAVFIFIVVFMLGAGFGANFVIYAGVISDYFGIDSFSRLYPICFLAYGIAGLIAPGSGGFIADTSGSYAAAIVIAIVLLVSTAIVLQLRLGVFQKKSA